MSKKSDFLQDQQNRDAHPDSGMTGSKASVESARRPAAVDATNPDAQAAHTGKVANDRNQSGQQAPTQKNEGRRTPDSRHDREAHIGSHNQTQARQEPRHGGEGGGASVGRNRK